MKEKILSLTNRIFIIISLIIGFIVGLSSAWDFMFIIGIIGGYFF